jgi:hypothetical protein
LQIQYVSKPVEALPVLSLYEYLSSTVSRWVFGTVNARVLRCRALISASLFYEASRVFVQLCEGQDLPSASSLDPFVSMKERDQSSKFDQVLSFSSSSFFFFPFLAPAPAAFSPPHVLRCLFFLSRQLFYNNHLPPTDEANRAFLNYLLIDLTAAPEYAALRAVYGDYIWTELLLLKAKFLCAIGSYRDLSGPSSPRLASPLLSSLPSFCLLSELLFVSLFLVCLSSCVSFALAI